jgi:hypothetical protein
MRSLIKDNQASVVPLMYYVLTVFVCGALYTLFFTEIALPSLGYLIPASEYKTVFMMFIYGIPIFIIIVGGIALMKKGLDRRGEYP